MTQEPMENEREDFNQIKEASIINPAEEILDFAAMPLLNLDQPALIRTYHHVGICERQAEA